MKQHQLMTLITILLSFMMLSSCSSDENVPTHEEAQTDEAEETIADTEENLTNDSTDATEEESESLRDKIDYTSPDSIHVLVNKEHTLPSDYTPTDLVVPDVRFPFAEDDPKKQLRKEAAQALEKLFAAAEAEGHYLYAISGYRSYERQEAIFASNVQKHGEEHANTFSARAGESEHQTGLVMDISSEAVGFQLVTEFGETPEGKWVQEHAHEYGFVVRYPEGKEAITKYQYEPWHLRYLGVEVATALYESGQTYEEYLGLAP